MKNKLDNQPAGNQLLFYSTLILGIAVLPHFFNIRASVMISFLALIAIKFASATVAPWLSRRWGILACAILFFSNSAWHYGIPLGRDPGVSFLIVLLGLKILESRTRRDLRIVLFLGFFVVVTHFLYFPNLILVVYLFTIVLATIWMLIQISHVNPERFLRSDLRLMLRMAIQAIPFALILFFLFPRFAGSLWLLQSPSSTSTTGMSDIMSMGTVSNLVESEEIAFTATFANQSIPPKWARYWRAGVLWSTDGKTWRQNRNLQHQQRNIRTSGPPYHYDINLDNNRGKWLYILDTVANAPTRTKLTVDGYLKRSPNSKKFAGYSVQSFLQYQDFTINDQLRILGTEIEPRLITPRMRELIDRNVSEVSVNGHVRAKEIANQFLRYFGEQPFSYTLRPARLFSDNPVDEFLFQSREGFCEHYAASFTTLMRGAGIPARVVVGYLGGELNPRANQITVRQSDAHAWSEYWSEENGWSRIDPTAAIAPERINNAINFLESFNQNGKVSFASYNLSWFENLIQEARWFSALAKVQWNRWFVGYDHLRQQKLLDYMGLGNFDPVRLIGLAFLFAILVLTVIAIVFFFRERLPQAKHIKAYQEWCSKLATLGMEKLHHESSMDYCRRIVKLLPDHEPATSSGRSTEFIAEFCVINQLYSDVQYSNKPDNAMAIELESRIKQFNKLMKQTDLRIIASGS